MSKFYHPYHLVTESPWPLLCSFSLLFFMIINMSLFNLIDLYLFFFNLIMLSFVVFQWWRDVIREGTFQGMHTFQVLSGLRLGMILFIVSEIMFFLSFFWTYFHLFLSPSMEMGVMWPPKGVLIFNPFNIPLLNTLILLSSGVSITWAHYMILIKKNYLEGGFGVILTVFLGGMFTFFQYMEYMESYFSICDSSYGSIFFMVTGFHGFHVFIGTLFILISFIRLINGHFSNFHHYGFEAASWYWHFVDIVWLFLYLFLYWFIY